MISIAVSPKQGADNRNNVAGHLRWPSALSVCTCSDVEIYCQFLREIGCQCSQQSVEARALVERSSMRWRGVRPRVSRKLGCARSQLSPELRKLNMEKASGDLYRHHLVVGASLNVLTVRCATFFGLSGFVAHSFVLFGVAGCHFLFSASTDLLALLSQSFLCARSPFAGIAFDSWRRPSARVASSCFPRPRFELGLSSRVPKISAKRARLSWPIGL